MINDFPTGLPSLSIGILSPETPVQLPTHSHNFACLSRVTRANNNLRSVFRGGFGDLAKRPDAAVEFLVKAT